MMLYWLFSVVLVVLAATYVWAFRALPKERWQFLAAIPVEKMDNGRWRAVNLSFYGFFSATACFLGGALFVALAGAAGLSWMGALTFLTALIFTGMVASRLVNRLASGTRYGFTVGGSALVGIIAAPIVLYLLKEYAGLVPEKVGIIQVMAALGAAYALGEGIGRWACVSFGCCYGRPISEAPHWVQPLLMRIHFTFEGRTKKAVYESGLEYKPLVPVQGLSAIVLTILAVLSVAAYLAAQYALAFLIAAIGTQGWRVMSEYLRKDERADGRWRKYQCMAVATAGTAVLITLLSGTQPATPPNPDAGWQTLRQVPVILILQAIWWMVFLRMGLSQVTGCDMAFFVREERL